MDTREIYQLRVEWAAEQGKDSRGTAADLDQYGHLPWRKSAVDWAADPIMPATIIAHLALRYPKRLTVAQIAKEIMRLYRVHQDPQPLVQFRRLQHATYHVVENFDFPILRTAETTSRFDRGYVRRHQALYSVTPEATSVFLGPYITDLRARISPGPGLDKPFRLMNLPQELRVQIYKSVLSIPFESNGIMLRKHAENTSISVTVLYGEEDHSHIACSSTYRGSTVFLYGTIRQLDLLSRVSKSVSRDALSTFFGVNNFVCTCLVHLRNFILSLPESRRSLVKIITLFYQNCHTELAPESFALLRDMDHVQDVHIYLTTYDFGESPRRFGERDGQWYGKDHTNLTGWDILLAMKASGRMKITFHVEWYRDDVAQDAFNAAVAAKVKALKAIPG